MKLPQIEFPKLLLAFIPVIISIAILAKWSMSYKTAIYGVSRMLTQLLLVGYFLVIIFNAENSYVVFIVVCIMVSVSSWISLRTIPDKRKRLLLRAFTSILIGGGLTLALITSGVLELKPWYAPRFFIPLAGMIFSNAMNCLSLAADRFNDETNNGKGYLEARNNALRTALIPITNSLFAVGIVSVPGMMTGQILSGISPLTAVRYQIMVMCMIYGSAVLSTALFLTFLKNDRALFSSSQTK